MYLTKKERDAIHDAIDFISTNIDGAEEESLNIHYELLGRLRSILAKHKTERHNNLVRYYVKKGLKKHS